MVTRIRRLALIAAISWLGFGVVGPAEAGGIALSTPAGLSPGESFRFVFVTDGTTHATSTSISTYNTFVANDASTQAGGGAVTYDGTVLTWSAIASTPSTSAISNIGESGASVWLTNGTEVASTDNASGLWSGNLSAPILTDLLGTPGDKGVWTGTTTSGGIYAGFSLGDAEVEGGNSTHSNFNWVSAGAENTTITPNGYMYGISQVLIAASVPEPSTLLMAGTGISGVFAMGWHRRRRNRRRQQPVGWPDATH